MDGIVIEYEGGSPCNEKFNKSSSITFRCSATELGPKFVLTTDDCHYVFEWLTPIACNKKTTATPPTDDVDECIVTDTILGNTYNLNKLHNATMDYEVKTKKHHFQLNVCKKMHYNCGVDGDKLLQTGGGASICGNIDGADKIIGYNQHGGSSSHLQYKHGTLMMKYIGQSCDHDPSAKVPFNNYETHVNIGHGSRHCGQNNTAVPAALTTVHMLYNYCMV